MVVAASIVAGCTGPVVVVSPSPAPVPTATPAGTSSPSSTPTPSARQTGNADFFFQPGTMRWCGLLVSYRAASATASGELKIGAVTFLPSVTQRVASDVRPGGWVCLDGTIIRSEIAANQLNDFSLETATVGSMPPGPIRASPCGLITALSITDLPSGGFITLNGTYFGIGGVRPAGASVELPPDGQLRVGVSVCITATTLRVIDAGSFTPIGGRVTVMR